MKGGADLGISLKTLKQNGAGACQIFVSSPIGRPSKTALENYRKIASKTIEIRKDMTIVIHSPYILNFATPLDDGEEWANTYWVKQMVMEMQIAEEIGAIGCVLHMGKHVHCKTKQDGLDNMYNGIAATVQMAMELGITKAKLILETPAGQGTELLTDIADLGIFWHRFNADQKRLLGICVDTAHIWGTGVPIRDEIAVQNYFDELDFELELGALSVVHLNNSLVKCGAKKDRHAGIFSSDGNIPVGALAETARAAKARGVPVILETPGPYEPEFKWLAEIYKS